MGEWALSHVKSQDVPGTQCQVINVFSHKLRMCFKSEVFLLLGIYYKKAISRQKMLT